jgi:CBS-domain-containing membrane protein/anti-sigma regulatory factor (Ser/Thr protein kinase)
MKSLKDVTIKEVMAVNVTCMFPYHRLSQAKEILRIKRISGVPVVDNERKIIGIISVEDIIKVLETKGFQGLDTEISEVMTKKVFTVKEDEPISKALLLFRKHNFGRLPVVDDNNKVIGILTLKDFVVKFAQYMDIDFYESERITSKSSEQPQESEDTGFVMEYPIIGGDFSIGGKASSEIKKTLQQLGVNSPIIRRVAVAAYEAEMNIIIHAFKGKLTVNIDSENIVITAQDEGPGIEDIDKAMKEGYSTASDYVRELGFGAGMGLPNMKRCSDIFDISSQKNIGTKVVMTIKL